MRDQKFQASTSDSTAARKKAELSNRSLLGIEVEWNWPVNTLFGSAPRSSRSLIRSSAVSLVRMIRAQPRAVKRKLIGGGVAHFHSGVQRSVVDIGAKIPQRCGQIKTIVVDGDHRRGSAVAVLEVQIRAALDQPPDDIFVAIARGPHQSRETAGRMIGILTFGESN